MNKKTKRLKLLLGILTTLLVVLIGLVLMLEFRKPDEQIAEVPTTEQTVPETVAAVETEPTETLPETEAPAAYAGIPVNTPCGTLYIPDEWDFAIETITMSGEKTVIDFLAEDTKLYSLIFSNTSDGAMGQVSVGDRVIYVAYEICELEGVSNQLLSMQESVNVLLAQLAPEPVSVSAETPDPNGDIQIETAYGVLYFPGKWGLYLQTMQKEDDSLEFYCCIPEREPVLVFTVRFGISEGGPASVITGADGTRTELVLIIAEPEFGDNWTAEEKETAYAMQEDMNYLLDALEK